MSRRRGQNGSISVVCGSWRGRFLLDVPGQFERVKKSVPLGSVKTTTKTDARLRLKEIIADLGINSPEYKIPSVSTLAERAEQWEGEYIVRMKPSNQRQLRSVLRRYLLPKWGRTPVDCISAEDVNQWIGEPMLRHLSPVTIRGIVRTLQLVLGRAFSKRTIHYPSKVNEQQEARCFTAGEVLTILSHASGMYRVLFTLAAETGMRAGEVYGLRVEDVDFDRHIVHVRRAMWDGKAQTPKTSNAYRAVDIQPYVTDMLKQHLAGRQSGLLFLSKRKTPLRNSVVVGKQLHPLLDKAEIPRGGMHAFRHFRVSFLVQNETPFEVIKRWIGHGADDMIRHYTHLHPSYRKQVMARIPAVVAAIAPTSDGAVLN